MADLPRLRPRQWALLERFVAVDQRLDQQPRAEPIAVALLSGVTQIVKPGVADPDIDRADLQALDEIGVFDVVSSTSTLLRFRVSQYGFDLAEKRTQAAGEPTPEERLATYRSRRRWLAARVSLIARWTVLLIGIAVVLWSALSGSWLFAAIGALGAIFGFPVTRLADQVHGRLTDLFDRLLLMVFEPKQ